MYLESHYSATGGYFQFPVNMLFYLLLIWLSNYGNLLIISQMRAFISFSSVCFPFQLPSLETDREQPVALARFTNCNPICSDLVLSRDHVFLQTFWNINTQIVLRFLIAEDWLLCGFLIRVLLVIPRSRWRLNRLILMSFRKMIG